MESVEEMVGHIADSAREHSRGSDLITMAVERMKDLTSHVRASTREQSRTSSLIARATEDAATMIGPDPQGQRLPGPEQFHDIQKRS